MIISNACKDTKKLSHLYVVSGNIKWYNHSEYGSFLQNLSICLPYNPTNTFPGIYSREMKAYVHWKTWT